MPKAKTGHRLPCGGYLALPTRILRDPSPEEFKAAIRKAAENEITTWPGRTAIEWFFATTELGIGTPVSEWSMTSGCGSSEVQPGFSVWLAIQGVLASLSSAQLNLVARRWAMKDLLAEKQKKYQRAMVKLHDIPPLDDSEAKVSMVCQGIVPMRDWFTLPNGAMIEPLKLWIFRKSLIPLDSRVKNS